MREEVYKRVSKLVSVIVVLNLGLGGFIGLMLIEKSANTEAAVSLPPKVGDTITINDARIIQGSDLDDGTLDADWNLIINGGAANLTLIDTTLIFQSDTSHRYSISVTGGGKLCLINSTITVQTNDLFDNYETAYWFNFITLGPNPTTETNFRRMIPFDITINGGQLMMFENSGLKYEGKLSITNSKTDIFDSVITSPSAPYSTHDWGVVVDIDSCSGANRVVIADTKIDKSPWFQGISYYDPDGPGPAVTMYENHTITNSDVYFINTYFDLDYRNKSTPALYKVGTDNHFPPNVNPDHNALNIITSTVKFVGLTIDMSETANMIPNDGSTSIEVIGGGSTVALYRWLRVYPVDNKSIPLANVQVDVSTIYTGDATINGLNNINNNVPVRDYIAANTDCTLSMVGNTIRANTGTSGRAVFALLSDLLTNADWPNSDQRDGYNILASYLTETVEGLVDFENFPRVFPQDNYVDFYLDPFSISVPHPELYPEFVTLPSSSALNGTTLDISVKVYNALIGVGQDASDVKVQFWDGNPVLNTSSKINEQIIPSLPKGTNVTLNQNWFATPPGAHNIYVGVDRDWEKPLQDNAIPEENENNNVIKASITVLDRPDLFINGSLIYFNPDDEVVNGTAVTINAQVQNIGGSTAHNVVVNFYDGTATGPSTFIGSATITVAAGSQITASVGWGPNVGFHYVWVYLDESNVILESDETNNVGSQSIDVKSRPNLAPTIVFDPSSPQYEGTVITIQAVVANSGGWNVTKPVIVRFYGPNNQDLLIGTKTIELDFQNVAIEAGKQKTVSITWTATYPPASDTFYVVVDPDNTIDESNEADNAVSAVFTVNPRPNLKITSSDITISDHYPMEGQNVVITMVIWNTGLSQVNTPFWVRIWLDDVGTGTLLNEFMVTSTIAPGGFITQPYNWNGVTPDGHHNVWIAVDYNNTVAETSESDNSAAGMIVIFKVPSDLIVNDATLYPPNPMGQLTLEDYWVSSDPYIRDGNTLVEQSGTLIVRNSIFKVVGQTRDNEFTIVVKDNGNLIIDENSLLTSEQYKVNIYLFDNAELFVTGSTIDTMIDIYARGNSKIYITENSAIYGDIYANENGSTLYIQAINSTFAKKLQYIGASTQVDLWGVYIAGLPASDAGVTVTGSAKVYIDWFLTVNIVDVNNQAIEGAMVMWYRSPPWKDTGVLNSNPEGKAFFRLRGMNVTAAGVVSDIGSYKVVSSFTSPYTTLTYYPDANVTLEMTQNKQKTIKFSSVKPDLDPPLGVSYPGSVLSVGDSATVHAYVNNTGPSTAVDVRVTFDDDTSEGGWPKTFINASIPPGGSWHIQFEWKPLLIGWHNISIWVDPSNLIVEEDEGNNYNSIPIYVTPQKADLTLGSGDIWFTYPSTGPTENDTVTIHANIRNIGETLANPPGGVEVKYYSNWPSANTFLGYGNISSISPGQTRESTFSWKPTPSRTFQITVVVDEIGSVEETNDLNNSASNSIYIKKYADVAPVGVEFYVQGSPVLSITDNTQVTLSATVINVGETDAFNVKVQFFDGDPGLGGSQIGQTKTLALLAAYSGAGETSVTWVSSVVGNSQEHSIFVVVSGITENVLGNNSYKRNITVTLRPILSVSDIWFSDESPFEGQEITIFATVRNTGGTDATGFYVGFWDGDPDLNASQINVYKPLTVAVNSTGSVNVTWLPSKGSHEIHVMADALENINEADETNNMASEVIVVYAERDIIVNNANTPYTRGSLGSPEPLALQHRGYTLVEENGVLTFTNVLFQVLQTEDYQFNIIVKNNGQMILEEGTMIYSDGPLIRIYLYDNSTLTIRDSTIQSTVVDIMAFGDSKIIIEESTVNSRIIADSPTANVRITATNSTLSQGFLNFGGTSKATFTDVVTPSVELSGNAELTAYQWLFAYVKDGAGTGIEGSEVTVTDLFSGQEVPGSPKTTGLNGLALFAVLTDIITGFTETSHLSFRVDAEFVYDSTTYVGNKSKTFTSYVKDRENNFIIVEIFLEALKPDLTMDSDDIKFFKSGVERGSVGVGETIDVQATVKNIGTAGTTLQTQVVVKFYHKSGTKTTLIGQDIIETPMAAKTGSGLAAITWIPKAEEVGDNVEIWVYVDPDNKVPELQDTQDNNAFKSVNVVRPPDLEVTNIRFDTSTNQDVGNTTESILVTISTTITNVGTDRPAAGIAVSVYDGFPDFNGDMKPDSPLPAGVTLIGTDSIATLLPGTSQFVSFSWDTTGKQKGHSIYVYAMDSTSVDYIGDQVLSNNNASRSFVVHPKPDIRPEIIPPQTQYLTLIRSDGIVQTGNPQIGQTLTLQATIFNYGQVYIQGATVRFFRENPAVAANQIGSNVTINIAPNSPINASVQWTVGAPDGNIEIFVLVNEDRKIVESDYTNNQESTTFSVAYANVNLGWTDIIDSKYEEGESIQIRARITFADGGGGLASQPFTIQIRDRKTNDIKSGPFSGTTDANGNIVRDITAPSPGEYTMEIDINYGTQKSLDKQFKVEGEMDILPIPLEWLLLIIVLIVVIIIVATVVMAKVGMGKLVECGECGAFIHEGEKKCPKCGAVFETETAKCSECGAWIPADSKSCPDCGAIFAGLDKEKKSYIESMKGRYQEYVDQFKPEAKDELGPAMSEEEFSEWWKTSPKYVGFEDWLKREEEVKKGRTKSCPACNSINPESAAICFKCGTVFQTPEQLRQAQMPQPEAAPVAPPAEVPAKRVPRTPEGAPPTMVPKKVVRPPEVVPKKVVRGPPTVVPKKVVRPPEGGGPPVVPKKVIRRPPEEEEQK